MYKNVFILGILVYAILLVLALIFFEERTAFLDIAYHLFYILKDGDFAIQNNRFGSCFTQVFPLIAGKLNLDLQNIMKVYSVAFVIVYASVFFVMMMVVKSYQFGLVMLLHCILMVTDTFFWIQSELPQGLAFLLLFFSFIVHKKNFANSIWYLPFITLGMLLVTFFHPLILFPFLFIVAFFYTKPHLQLKPILVSLVITFFGIVVLKQLFFKTTYDSAALGGLKNFITLFPNYVTLQSNINFIKYVLVDYQIIAFVFFVLLFFYGRLKQFYKLLLLLVFVGGYFLLVNVSFNNGEEQFYMENLYLPLSIMIIIPFVFDFIPSIPSKYIMPILCLVLAVRLFQIGLNHQPYTERLTYLKQILDKTEQLENKKIIIPTSALSEDKLMMTWASPYEFWLLSTTHTNSTRSVFITDAPNEISWALPERKKFITKWGAFDYHTLPKPYFILDDTSSYFILRKF